MKIEKEKFLQFMDLVVEVTDPQYRDMMAGIREYYREHGSLSVRQKGIIENTVKFRVLNV